MKIGVAIDFDNVYEIKNLSADLKSFCFESILVDNSTITLYVVFNNNYNNFVPFVYNLAFGPLKEDGKINDRAVLKHKDNNKVYSTILLGALTFLNGSGDTDIWVGIDGSDITRAYLYYKLFQSNCDYLGKYFKVLGVKYFIRLLRGKTNADPYVGDFEDVATQPYPILKGQNMGHHKLYNYFVFKLP